MFSNRVTLPERGSSVAPAPDLTKRPRSGIAPYPGQSQHPLQPTTGLVQDSVVRLLIAISSVKAKPKSHHLSPPTHPKTPQFS
jgi:hypothetical protein